jgi:hypothetical protein
MNNELKWGREDCQSDAEAQTYSGTAPNPSDGVTAFKDNFLNKGFTDEEIVALSYIYAFGTVRHPNQVLRSNSPIFNNYYYKHLMTGADATGSIDTVLRDDSFAEHVERFATDKTAFYSTFAQGFHKMINLGHDESKLNMFEDFMDDHPMLEFGTEEELYGPHQ